MGFEAIEGCRGVDPARTYTSASPLKAGTIQHIGLHDWSHHLEAYLGLHSQHGTMPEGPNETKNWGHIPYLL